MDMDPGGIRQKIKQKHEEVIRFKAEERRKDKAMIYSKVKKTIEDCFAYATELPVNVNQAMNTLRAARGNLYNTYTSEEELSSQFVEVTNSILAEYNESASTSARYELRVESIEKKESTYTLYNVYLIDEVVVKE
jgi:hypothetical protein